MNTFQRTETIILKLTVTVTATGLPADPSSSLKISVTDPAGTVVVDAQNMVKDAGTGNYHYDYTPGGSAVVGQYRARHTAVDGTRTTVKDDYFMVTA